MQDSIGIPACFSSTSHDDHQYHQGAVTRSVSVENPEKETQYSCKVELKPWYFWRKQGSKRFAVDGKEVDVFWDLKSAKFNGETEPTSEYYVAVVCDEEVVLLVGDLKKEAYKKTGCRPSLIDPILVSKKEHIFGKRKFSTKAKFHEKDRCHEICIKCKNKGNMNVVGDEDKVKVEPEMEIRFDGELMIHVKHLQWKFRGNESVYLNKTRVERSSNSTCESLEGHSGSDSSSSEFCLFLYAWKVE
ncbi:unnamed protein product [Vicia faba]|uniref:Uncharacterized protein n=1 Tax=Vicia faba TaxID=3906 RepID=A0AAV0ZL26_VICFA|nr:unnamed protein product [Vicia faba]